MLHFIPQCWWYTLLPCPQVMVCHSFYQYSARFRISKYLLFISPAAGLPVEWLTSSFIVTLMFYVYYPPLFFSAAVLVSFGNVPSCACGFYWLSSSRFPLHVHHTNSSQLDHSSHILTFAKLHQLFFAPEISVIGTYNYRVPRRMSLMSIPIKHA